MWQAIIAAVLSGGIFAFIEFLIRRKDDKNSVLKDIVNRLERLENKVDEGDAINSRVRILHFADEMMEERRHSKDSFDQVLSDITFYNNYCSTHPDFKNSQTEATAAFIKRKYEERLEKHDFS